MQIFKYILPRGLSCVNYSTKHNLSEYRNALESNGFRILEKHYYVPYKLRIFRNLLNNSIANCFLTSAFVIYADNPNLRVI